MLARNRYVGENVQDGNKLKYADGNEKCMLRGKI